MYRNEFDRQLQNNKIYSAYMFYGQSTYLCEYYAKMVCESLAENREDIERIYFDDYDFKYLKDKLLQSSLFASSNIVLVKLDKKLPKKEVDELIKACNTNTDSKVIFVCLGDSDFRTMGNYFSDKTNSVSVRMFSPPNYEALKILEREASNLGISFETSALNHLYFMHKNKLSLCVNDLKKLAILNKTITANIVNEHCFGIGNVSFEDFLHNLLEGKDISDDLDLILEEGMNEIYLLSQITSFVQQLFMISSYARTIGQANPKEILGFIPPKDIWARKSRLAINIKPEIYEEILEYLLNIELELKSSRIDNAQRYIQASLRKFTVLFR